MDVSSSPAGSKSKWQDQNGTAQFSIASDKAVVLCDEYAWAPIRNQLSRLGTRD